MKINNRLILFFWVAAICQITATARVLDAQIVVHAAADNAELVITGKLSAAQTRWSWIDSYANANNLGRRFSEPQFFNEQNAEIGFIKHASDQFETATPANSFRRTVKLDFSKTAAQSAHVSWLKKNGGVLMLGDLLPDFGDETIAGKINFVLPNDWRIATSENKTGENKFATADASRSIFMVGDFNEQQLPFEKTTINLAQIGEWTFTSRETLDFAAKIIAEYQRVFGAAPNGKIQILLFPFEQKFGGELWEAETRGSTVVLCAAQIAFKSRALSRLHEQLRHELFHLWAPNDLNLTGDYAWFYEGFGLYQALKTGVRLKYIRFEDFLDALARAYDAARQNPNGKTISLLEASRLRWQSDFSEFVYAKGMTGAFLSDLALLEKSGGKKSLDDVFKELYRRHRKPQAAQNAKTVVFAFLRTPSELRLLIERYVETAGEIDWTPEITAAGLKNVSKISLTRLAPAEKLNGRQKKLLARLGHQTIEN